MSELLSIIDADGTETAVTVANNLRWQFPIKGAWERKDSIKFQSLLHPRWQMILGPVEKLATLTLTLGILGQGRSQLEERLDALLWMTDPERGASAGSFWLKRTNSRGQVRRAVVIRDAYSVDGSTLQQAGPTLLPVTLTLVMPWGTWYDPTATTVVGAVDGATPVVLAIPGGRVAAHGTVTVAGVVAAPKLTATGGDFISFPGSLAAGDVLTIDFRPDSAAYGAWVVRADTSVEDWTHYRDELSRWFAFPPGPDTKLTLTATSGAGAVTVVYNKHYKTEV
jgi:hypothetical protein